MYLRFRGVNEAFRELVSMFARCDSSIMERPSRNGPVLRLEEPALLTYTNPTERVLFNQSREVNCFSVLYESLWVLAGRNDVAPIAHYTKRMVDYSDDGKTWRGAYGHRWRHAFGGDQLNKAVELLRATPTSRRVVLAMWDGRLDLLEQQPEMKDLPCNTHAYLSVRDGNLDLTVCNRSNDLVWGLLAANYVEFSFLLEYLAARVGVGVGVYHHFTNDLHVYLNNFKPEEWLAEKPEADYPKAFPLIRDPEVFDRELPAFVDLNRGPEEPTCEVSWQEPFFRDVASPMLRAFHRHKAKDTEGAVVWAGRIAADDWRIAATSWLTRRLERRKADGVSAGAN